MYSYAKKENHILGWRKRRPVRYHVKTLRKILYEKSLDLNHNNNAFAIDISLVII